MLIQLNPENNLLDIMVSGMREGGIKLFTDATFTDILTDPRNSSNVPGIFSMCKHTAIKRLVEEKNNKYRVLLQSLRYSFQDTAVEFFGNKQVVRGLRSYQSTRREGP